MANTQKNKHKSRIRQRKSRREIWSRMYKNYSDEMLEIACVAVKSHQISSRDVERQFGIPRRMIVNKIKNKHTKSVGHPTVLSNREEKKIVGVLQAASDFGSPLTKVDLKLVVYKYFKIKSRDHKFKNRIPGDAWVQGFLARHADELTIRSTQNISKARAEKGPQEIADYFDNLSTTLKDIPAENIINLDETNLSDDPSSTKSIFRRGVKYPERVVNSTKGNICLRFTVTASGKCLYVVYKATKKKKAKKDSSGVTLEGNTKENPSGVAKIKRINVNAQFLDEQTGLFGKTDQTSNYDITEDQDYDLEETFNIFRNNFTPESLSKCCINIINSYLDQSLDNDTTSSTSADNFSFLKAVAITSTFMARKDNQRSVKNGPAKINILSNVLIKAGIQNSDVPILNVSNNIEENMLYVAMCNSDLPKCLQGKETTFKKKRKGKNVSKGQKSARGHTSVKRRKKRSKSESSSTSTDIEIHRTLSNP